jgi:hypothetical protein
MISFSQYIAENPISLKQRSGRSRAMKRHSGLIKMKKKLSDRTRATRDELMIRAERQARRSIRDEMCGEENYRDLSDVRKLVIDKKVELKKNKMKLLAQKLFKKVTEDEKRRLERKKTAATTA